MAHHVMAGTRETQTEHTVEWSLVGVMLAMGVPVIVAVTGVAVHGFGAIRWLDAIVWGVVATVAFTVFSMMGKRMGMTRMDLLDLLGSMFAPPGSTVSRALGAGMHHMNGALLAIAWAYGAVLVGVSANVGSAVAWSVVLWVLALVLMSSIGGVHPAIRRGDQVDPGPAATHLGAMTPVGSLVGHIVYGVVLGLGYQFLPLG